MCSVVIPYLESPGLSIISLLILKIPPGLKRQLISQWNKNNHSPRLTVPATVVTKRSSHHHGGANGHHHSSTSYYV
ncbi:MAG: DUF2500 family protein, partial [Lachnospiraceae bacterium]|nr:DUF2500 family protein [Lachnospiraceae bacterium]